MKSVEIDGVEYKSYPEAHGCDGCVGDRDIDLCMALPEGCSDERVIWVRKD
ncbi:hypothetical protein [Burkholderia cenocepacia]|uniref:hypothetical protein n=1 Tax=Burkholderia cenocepacia TaxID=95486 RepID=UPI001BAA73D7|nr:hypothetical protein [Burkholderia cenocepacia]QUN58889.1 hypothetical protein KEH58_24315 [Burkholderia cenocepacia]